MSTKKHILQVLSNTNFNINYKDLSLQPQVELILLYQEPKYEAKLSKDKKHFIPQKGNRLDEARFLLSTDKLNAMIAELQALAENLQMFEQLAHGLNGIIESSMKKADQH